MYQNRSKWRVSVSALFLAALFLPGQAVGAPLSGRIDGGDYTQPIVGPAELSGNISVTLTEDHVSAISVDAAQNYVKGTVGRLALSTSGAWSNGLQNLGGHLALSGNVVITTRGDNANGILHASPSAVTLISGPLTIRTYGQYANAVNVNDGANSGPAVTLDGPNTFTVSGYGAAGVNIFGGSAILGETSIVSTGDAGRGIYALGGDLVLNGPIFIRATGTDSFALLVEGKAPYSHNVVSTRLRANIPNPQKIDIEGAIRIYGQGNELELDLAAGSHLNSRIMEADNGGNIRLNFFGSDARWTTGMGSIIHNGASLGLDFRNGGEWLLPATDASNAALASPSIPLHIEGTGQLTFGGNPVLRVTPHTSLSANQSASYLMVQADNGLPAGMTSMGLATGNLLYRLDSISEISVGGRPTLQATLTRRSNDDSLPDLSPGPGDLLPDGGNADDGGGNPFLALALAQHFNGLSLDEITSALEGAPAMTRVLPLTSLTRDLERHVRGASPVATLYGGGPRAAYALNSSDPGQASSLAAGDGASPAQNNHETWETPGLTRVWLSPLYLHDSERIRYEDGMSTRYRTDMGGALLGLDHSLGKWTLGGGLSLGTGRTTSGDSGSMPRTDGRVSYGGFLAYALFESGDWSAGLEASMLRTHSRLDQRNPVMPLHSSVNVDAFGAEFVVVRRFAVGDWRLTPSAGLEFGHLKQHKNTVVGRLPNGSETALFENGAVYQNLWRAPLGVKFSRVFTMGEASSTPRHPALSGPWAIQPELRLRYIPILGKTGYALHVWRSDAPNIRAVLPGPRSDRHTFEAGAGLGIRRGPANLSLGYAWQRSSNRSAHFVSTLIGLAF